MMRAPEPVLMEIPLHVREIIFRKVGFAARTTLRRVSKDVKYDIDNLKINYKSVELKFSNQAAIWTFVENDDESFSVKYTFEWSTWTREVYQKHRKSRTALVNMGTSIRREVLRNVGRLLWNDNISIGKLTILNKGLEESQFFWYLKSLLSRRARSIPIAHLIWISDVPVTRFQDIFKHFKAKILEFRGERDFTVSHPFPVEMVRQMEAWKVANEIRLEQNDEVLETEHDYPTRVTRQIYGDFEKIHITAHTVSRRSVQVLIEQFKQHPTLQKCTLHFKTFNDFWDVFGFGTTIKIDLNTFRKLNASIDREQQIIEINVL